MVMSYTLQGNALAKLKRNLVEAPVPSPKQHQKKSKSERRTKLIALNIDPTRLLVRDLFLESWRSISRNYARSGLTAIGTLLGCAAFVAALGITGTASHQVSSAFDMRRATEVTVIANAPILEDQSDLATPLQWFSRDAVAKLELVGGVENAGRVLSWAAAPISRFLIHEDSPTPIDVYALDSGSLDAVRPQLVEGRSFDFGHNARADRVIMLSLPVAKALGISHTGDAVFINDHGFTVIGIFQETQRLAALSGAVILPIHTAESLALSGDSATTKQLLIETLPGAAAQVGSQTPFVIDPSHPNDLTVIAPPDPTTLRQEIESSVTQLSLLVSLVILAMGGVSIANAAAVSVVLRTPEIGLRRALGARKTDIFLQLLGETVALGALGGIVGSLLGTLAIVIVSAINQWVPVLDPSILLAAVGSGILAGILAGLWPAAKATQITPAQALTR